MRVSLTWQQVALVAVLLAAIICAHIFAPLAASAVISIASCLTGTFFVNVQRAADATPTLPSPAPDPNRAIGFLPPKGGAS
jgi:hypothetical protein